MHTFFNLLLSFLTNCLFACSTKVVISTQVQFDQAIDRINNGEELNIVLKKGSYSLHKSVAARAPLTIYGTGATIIGAVQPYMKKNAIKTTNSHNVYKIENKISVFPLFFDEKGDLLTLSESVIDSIGVNYLEGDIESSQDYGKGVKLKIPISSNLVHLKNQVFACSFGYLDSGWGVVNFRIERSDSQYFYCTSMSECATRNFHYDRDVYRKPVRIVIYNAEIKPNAVYFDFGYMYVPKSYSTVYASNIGNAPTIKTYSDVEFKGITFVGIHGVKITSAAKGICVLSECQFRNCLGRALCIDKKNEKGATVAKVRDCNFMNCSLLSENVILLKSTIIGTPCISMSHCTVSRYPEGNVGYKNTNGAVWVNGDVILSENVIYNTCRDHLFLQFGSIVAQGNFLYNTDSFNSKKDRNLSSDWGLVYCNHLFKDTEKALSNNRNHILLENNLLYGAYAYSGDARGVFIDDGRGDVNCRNNVVINSQSFSIDARNINFMDASSVRNRYEGNIVCTRYRLTAGPAVNGNDIPVTKGNILLSGRDNIVANSLIIENDVRKVIKQRCYFYNGRVHVPKEMHALLMTSPAWIRIKEFIESK